MKFRTKFVAVAMGVLSAILLNASTSQAATTWDAVKQKVASAKDYSCTYEYVGPKGKYNLEYACINNPLSVRTKILRGSQDRVGAITVFDSAKDANKVYIRYGGGQLTRNLDHKDVSGTTLYQSVFGLIIKDCGPGNPTVSAGDAWKGKPTTLFTFNNGCKVWAIDDGTIVRSQKVEGSTVKEERKFDDVQWNVNPKTSF